MVHSNFKKNDFIKNKDKEGNNQTRWQFCVAKFVEFCSRTDLHGFKYLFMKDLNIIERSFWGVAIVISIICAADFVETAYRWYAQNPVVTVIETTQGAIWDVPFPAVTICNLNIVSKKAALKFAKNVTLPEGVTSNDVFRILKFTPLLHSLTLANHNETKDLHILQNVLDLNDISVEAMFKMLSPVSSCNNLLDRCMWKTSIYRCEQLFRRISVVVNLCCTFNFYAVDAEISEDVTLLRMPNPRRIASCGYHSALTVMIKLDPSDYYSTGVASSGVMVFVDSAYNWPDYDSPLRVVNPATQVLIALSPETTYATYGVRYFDPQQRQCYYNNEGNKYANRSDRKSQGQMLMVSMGGLKNRKPTVINKDAITVKMGVFNQYSFHNCMAYQKMELFKSVCDCVPFYFPQKDFHRICNFHDMECMDRLISPDVSDQEVMREHRQLSMTKCLPECEHYDYPMEVALGKLAMNTLSTVAFYDNMKLDNNSIVNVFFQDLVSTKYRRDVNLNWQNILAAFGGLLSLMLGFTLIAGIDFIIFFVLRVVCASFARLFSEDAPQTRQEPYVINVKESQRYGDQNYKLYTDDFKIGLRHGKNKI